MNDPIPDRYYVVFLILGLMPTAHADIFKCTDEHGNVAYLQTPCPIEVPREQAAVDDVADSVAEESEDVTVFSPEPQTAEAKVVSSRRPDEPLEDCKKRYRDQIDAIDAEIGASLSSAQASDYKERLLVLTRQLRACG